MNRRDFIGGALALAGGAAFGDEYVATNEKLPPGSIGDPANVNFARYVFPQPHTSEDGESAALKDGEVYLPRRKVPNGSGPAVEMVWFQKEPQTAPSADWAL